MARHCEEASPTKQSRTTARSLPLDCFASLAMTTYSKQTGSTLADGLLRRHHPGVCGGAGDEPAGVTAEAPFEKCDGVAVADDLSFAEQRSRRRRPRKHTVMAIVAG